MNQLASARSSYLKSAAHQPVAWQAWGAAAFEQARREDKPILLDIGAVWCHWCHVMDRESYENAETAAVINRLFVAVKVDRDERPDVDTRYQKAIQAMTGQGGWPLTAFLLPDGRCFYGGTYFPPVDAHGRPAFKRVLEAVGDAYRTRREELLANADELTRHLGGGRGAVGGGTASEWTDADLAHAAAHMREAHDPEHGGFGGAPKFPHPATHDFLLARAAAGDASAGDVARFTLEKMRAGGVYDQLGGGFHRYSVDAEWIVPHFEKMLYDNAGLLRNYARAGLLDDAADIKRFLRDVLRQPSGAFGGSQDADIDLDDDSDASRAVSSSSRRWLDDGDFFTWTLNELRAACSNQDVAKLMAANYGVREKGDIDGGSRRAAAAPGRGQMHHDPRRCVLRVEADADALAAAFHLTRDRVDALLARGKREMQDARAKRTAPFVDPVQYVAWNAMAIQALYELGGRAGDAEADALATRALDALLASCYQPERGWSRTPGGAVGLLDDNAQALDALLEAHFATGDARYLDAARGTADLLLRAFAHPNGGFADRASSLAGEAETAPLAQPERPTQDAPTASPNGVACRALLRLADATGDARYHDAAMAALRCLASEAIHLGVFGGALLLAMHEALHPPPRIVVRGDVDAYRAVARRHARPGATLARPEDAGVPEEARAFPGEGAMVCVGTRCLAPARSPEDLEARLRDA